MRFPPPRSPSLVAKGARFRRARRRVAAAWRRELAPCSKKRRAGRFDRLLAIEPNQPCRRRRRPAQLFGLLDFVAERAAALQPSAVRRRQQQHWSQQRQQSNNNDRHAYGSPRVECRILFRDSDSRRSVTAVFSYATPAPPNFYSTNDDGTAVTLYGQTTTAKFECSFVSSPASPHRLIDFLRACRAVPQLCQRRFLDSFRRATSMSRRATPNSRLARSAFSASTVDTSSIAAPRCACDLWVRGRSELDGRLSSSTCHDSGRVSVTHPPQCTICDSIVDAGSCECFAALCAFSTHHNQQMAAEISMSGASLTIVADQRLPDDQTKIGENNKNRMRMLYLSVVSLIRSWCSFRLSCLQLCSRAVSACRRRPCSRRSRWRTRTRATSASIRLPIKCVVDEEAVQMLTVISAFVDLRARAPACIRASSTTR